MASRLKEAVWPSMGWRRIGRYYRHRLFRTGDSNYKIAAGFANGVAVSFSPFVGTHVLQTLFLSWLLRASFIAGFIGTAIGNPWTLPFIFMLIYKAGVVICGLFGLTDFIALPGNLALHSFFEKPLEFMAFLFTHPFTLLLPLTVGGFVYGIVLWPLIFVVLYYPVRRARQLYDRQREKMRKGPL